MNEKEHSDSELYYITTSKKLKKITLIAILTKLKQAGISANARFIFVIKKCHVINYLL